VFGKSDEAKAARQAEKAAARRQRILDHRYGAWLEAPLGKARTAKEVGSKWFQVELNLEVERAKASAYLWGWARTSVSRLDDVGGMITAIEEEGWKLQHAGFLFRPTDSVTTNRSSGHSTMHIAAGKTLGVYLFANDGSPARTSQPWLDELESAPEEDPESEVGEVIGEQIATEARAATSGATATPGWYPDPTGAQPLRYWDGASWWRDGEGPAGA
jgi:hypothetical protein